MGGGAPHSEEAEQNKWNIPFGASGEAELGLWKRVQVSRPPSKPNLIYIHTIYIHTIHIPRIPNCENCENPNMAILMYGSN